MMEAMYWLFIFTVFIGGVVASCAIYEVFFLDTPFTQAEWRRKANERFKEIIGE
jgi:hypothetical protein